MLGQHRFGKKLQAVGWMLTMGEGHDLSSEHAVTIAGAESYRLPHDCGEAIAQWTPSRTAVSASDGNHQDSRRISAGNPSHS